MRGILKVSAAIWVLVVGHATRCGVEAAPLRIMPLGDSSTAGNDNFNLTPGGYRTTLSGLLTNAGYDYDFVGSLQTNPGPILDNDHEGHGGLQLSQIAHFMRAPLQVHQPDAVLLLGGTNDVTVALHGQPELTAEVIAGRLDTLLSALYVDRPNATVFVATILAAAPTEVAHAELSAAVNSLIPQVLAMHVAAGRDVHLVDLRALLTSADLADSVHPSPMGYEKIGHAWFDAIMSVLPVPLPGDINGDGVVNIFDVNTVAANWRAIGTNTADANHDGVVNIFDINVIFTQSP